MKQVNKFYLASFLKNQTYFVPIIVLFFQDLGLSYSEIFWIFTSGSIFSFIIEIPTGVFADLYGKRRSILISKFLIFVAFISFGLSYSFWTLLFANLVYELGKSFRSGTETAYIYSYLDQTKYTPSYTYVKANQKFYARISEGIGTALGGFIAYQFGMPVAFLTASIPAFINFVQSFSWIKLQECLKHQKQKFDYKAFFSKKSLLEVLKRRELRIIVFNIALFSSAVLSLDKFVQPYMQNVGVELKYIGLIYSMFLFLVAWLARYASVLEKKFGAVRIINILTGLSIIPVLILGFGISSLWGIALFFFVLMVENVRSPIANTLFHSYVLPENRATMGSILSLFKSSARLIVFPLIGYAADIFSMEIAMFAITIIIVLTISVFWLRPYKPYIKI